MKRKLVLILVFAMTFFAAASLAFAGGSGEAKAASTELIFSSELPTAHVANVAYRKFASSLESYSGGKYKMAVFDSSSLGSAREALESILVGTVHAAGVLEVMSFWVREMEIMGIPYLFRDMDHISKFMESPSGKEFQGKMTEAGFYPVCYFPRASRQLTANRRIERVADLKGLKLRVPETSTGPAAWNAMGATTVTMPFGEVFPALQQGVIDAQENIIDQIVSAKMYEVQRYVILTSHQFQASMVVFSAKMYNAMSATEKQWVDKAGADCAALEAELSRKATAEAEGYLTKRGTEIIRVDTTEFAQAASKAYAGYTPLMQEWIRRVQEIK